MASLADIRSALAAALQPALDATGGGQASAYMLANPTPPTMQVMGPDEVDYDDAMGPRGHDVFRMIVQTFAGSPADVGQQVNLDKWIAKSGVGSVKAALEADVTLGGKVAAVHVSRCSGYRQYMLPNHGETLGAEFTVTVHNPYT